MSETKMKTILTIALTFIVWVGMAQRNNTLIINDGISSTGSIKNWQYLAPDSPRVKRKGKIIASGFRSNGLRDSTYKVFGYGTSKAINYGKIIKGYKVEPMMGIFYHWVRVSDKGKVLLDIDRYPRDLNKPVESITIHVTRSNTVWLNDSTLVIKP